MATTYRVEGMSCGGCAASVERAIKAAAPGVGVAVDLVAKQVSVDGPVTEDVVRGAVESAGFEFKGA